MHSEAQQKGAEQTMWDEHLYSQLPEAVRRYIDATEEYTKKVFSHLSLDELQLTVSLLMKRLNQAGLERICDIEKEKGDPLSAALAQLAALMHRKMSGDGRLSDTDRNALHQMVDLYADDLEKGGNGADGTFEK